MISTGIAMETEFRKHDLDGDGLLNADELRSFFNVALPLPNVGRLFSMKSTEAFLRSHGVRRVRDIRAPNEMFIPAERFPALVQNIDDLLQKFRRFDVDHSGQISCLEMSRAFQQCGVACDDKTIDEIGATYDQDGNGFLEFDEFCEFMLEWEFYGRIFEKTDTNRDGFISLFDVWNLLNEMNALNSSPTYSWANQWNNQFRADQRPFSGRTCWLLLTKFGILRDSAKLPELNFAKFGQMLMYLIKLKDTFVRLDKQNNNKITSDELSHAFACMGLVIPQALMLKIGELYDDDKSGALEFDEFCVLLTEWDKYIELFNHYAQLPPIGKGDLPTNNNTNQILQRGWSGRSVHSHDSALSNEMGITAEGLQSVLNVMPDVNIFHPTSLDEICRARNESSRLFESLRYMRDFHIKTCNVLMHQFAANGRCLTLLEFCEVLEFIKSQKIIFNKCNTGRSGYLSMQELHQAFHQDGIVFSGEALKNVIETYDVDFDFRLENPASLSFDSFVYLRTELNVYKLCFDKFADRSGNMTFNFSKMMEFIYQIPRRTPAGRNNS